MTLIGYGAFGQKSCPGQEVFNEVIGACMCPTGMKSTGIVGECVPEAQAVPSWGKTCPTYTKVTGGCVCPSGHAYDPVKQMCTKEAAVAVVHAGATTIASSPTGPAPSGPQPAGEKKLAGMGVGGWAVLAVAAGAVAYIAATQG